MRKTISLVVCILILGLCGAVSAKPYTISDLGNTIINTNSINNYCQIAGTSQDADFNTSAVLIDGGNITTIGTLGGLTSAGKAINNSGAVAGYSETASWDYHAFIWQSGLMQDIGTLGGPSSQALSINDAGQATGSSYTAEGMNHAFIWSNGIMTDLGPWDSPYSQGRHINNNGQVAGFSMDMNYNMRALIWDNGTVIDPGINGIAYSINDLGTTVGAGYDLSHAFKYENGVSVDLGTLGGATSIAYDINNKGQIVGSSENANAITTACMWDNGVIIDLNSIIPAGTGWSLAEAVSINDEGDITGWGSLNGEMRSFLLSPVKKLPVVIDIKPNDSANTINCKAKGMVPVAVLACPIEGSEKYFDPTTIDPSTVVFAGASVAKVNNGSYSMVKTDVNADGRMDLVLNFANESLSLTGSDTTAVLDGATFDGQEITGENSVRVINTLTAGTLITNQPVKHK